MPLVPCSRTKGDERWGQEYMARRRIWCRYKVRLGKATEASIADAPTLDYNQVPYFLVARLQLKEAHVPSLPQVNRDTALRIAEVCIGV